MTSEKEDEHARPEDTTRQEHAAPSERDVLLERFSTAHRVASIGIFEWDGMHGTLYWSPSLLALLGLEDEDHTPSPELWYERMSESCREPTKRAFADACATRKGSFETEHGVCLPGGSERWLRVSSLLYFTQTGRLHRVVGAAVDVDGLRQRLASASRERELVERSSAIVAHDLGNPLSAIATSAEQLLRSVLTLQQQRAATRIAKAAHRMTQMLDQLLDLTRIRADCGLPIERSTCDLAELAAELVSELDAAYPDRRVQLDVTGNLAGSWDRPRLGQLLSNLLGNAAQHAPAGHEVRLRLMGSPDAVHLSVHNSGTIPERLLPELFKPFSSEKVRTSSTRRLGLGLYICHEIVRAHGGAIHVESTPEQGTAVHVQLPRSP